MNDDHQPSVPVALEQMLAGVSQLEAIFGEPGRVAAIAIRARIVDAMAARDRGDTPAMVDAIGQAMRELAAIAHRVAPGDAQSMAAVTAHFRKSLLSGDLAAAKGVMDVMFDASGARYRTEDGD